MYSLGQKYEVPLLCNYALKHFRHALKDCCWRPQELEDLKAAAKLAYCSEGPRCSEIREAIVESSIFNIHRLVEVDTLIKAIREEFPKLATDILIGIFGANSKKWRFNCLRAAQGHAACGFELQ